MPDRSAPAPQRGTVPAHIAASNEDYTRRWIAERGLDAVPVPATELQSASPSKAEANMFMVTWLRNVDRIISAVRKEARLGDLSFLDVGCGTGIPSCYACARYRFASVGGFDLDAGLVERAKSNASRALEASSAEVRFWEDDAAEIRLPQARYLLFLFNPFSQRVLTKFVENNLEVLRASASFLGLANDHGIEAVLEFPGTRLAWRSQRYNCSLVGFNAGR